MNVGTQRWKGKKKKKKNVSAPQAGRQISTLTTPKVVLAAQAKREREK